MLKGFKTVKECVDNEELNAYLRACIFDEIIPTLDLPEEELVQYAEDVLERFANPFVKHQLLSIALNSVSKFKARVLPTILEYYEANKKLPKCMCFSLAALIAFYRTDEANDGEEIMAFMKDASVASILKEEQYWGCDLSFMLKEVEKWNMLMAEQGMEAAFKEVLK